MKTVQIIRFVMAELFTAITVLLFYKAATEENLYWVITLGVLGVITAVIAVVAIVLFIQENKKGFTFLDKIEARNAKKRIVIKHTNDWHWGTDVSFIAADGMAHIAVSFQSDRQFGWIHDLFVHPDARRQGYATRLLALAEQEAKERGMNAVRLMVEFERDFVLDWYKRQGYSDNYPGQCFTNKYTELQKEL